VLNCILKDAISMDPQLETANLLRGPETRIGIALRVLFFVATVFISLQLLTPLLLSVFGTVVAGTVGLLGTGLLANLLTIRIFDRHPLVAIGLGPGRSSAWNFVLGAVFVAIVIFMPEGLVPGVGRLVAAAHRRRRAPRSPAPLGARGGAP